MLLWIYFVKYNRETLLWQSMQIYRKQRGQNLCFAQTDTFYYDLIRFDKKSQTKNMETKQQNKVFGK